MKKKAYLFNLLVIVVVFVVACNLPSGTQGDDAVGTAAAETLAVVLSASPISGANTPSATASLTPAGAPATVTPSNTNTPLPTSTSNCNRMEFKSDVTIPDGTIMTPGQAFTKTWRIKNVGTCTWTPSYAVVFSSGNSMNGPATQALVGNVNPGDQIDIPVNLTAPGSPGEYTGYWKLRDGSGVLFDQFYVQIKVQNAVPATNTLPPAIALAVLTNIAGESGQVRSDGSVLLPTNAGDLADGRVEEAFVSFDMTAIPGGANVVKVIVDFGTGHDILGNPWSLGIGCLHAYVQNYGTLDAGDFTSGDPSGAATKWCGDAEINSVYEDTGMKSVVQNAVGHSRLQLRLQFRAPTTNSDGIADTIRLGPVKLTVTYQ